MGLVPALGTKSYSTTRTRSIRRQHALYKPITPHLTESCATSREWAFMVYMFLNILDSVNRIIFRITTL